MAFFFAVKGAMLDKDQVTRMLLLTMRRQIDALLTGVPRMPVKITKFDGFKVSTPGGVKAKGTTKAKAHAQKRIIEAADKRKR